MATPVIELHERLRRAGMEEPQAAAVAGAFEALERAVDGVEHRLGERIDAVEQRLDRVEGWQRTHTVFLTIILGAVLGPYVAALFWLTAGAGVPPVWGARARRKNSLLPRARARRPRGGGECRAGRRRRPDVSGFQPAWLTAQAEPRPSPLAAPLVHQKGFGSTKPPFRSVHPTRAAGRPSERPHAHGRRRLPRSRRTGPGGRRRSRPRARPDRA
jgi:hypothetical protein